MALLGTIGWILAVVAAVWVIVDIWTKQKKMEQGMKILWTVLAVIFSIITAIIYYFVVYKK
jgi:prolipoprotein diacylglyceryltransferase